MSLFDYGFDFSFLPHYSKIIGKGIVITLELSILTIAFATIIGTILGVLMSRKNALIKCPFICYTDIIRSIPVLILILLVYYAFPVIGLKKVDAFIPACVALVINNSVFLGDLIRGSIEGLPKGSIQAAKVLGFNKMTTIRRIILPEVYREIFPSVTFLYISIIKLTSLASIIAVYEITHVGEWIISSTYKPLEMYIVIALIYLMIILPLTIFARHLEKSSYFKRRSV